MIAITSRPDRVNIHSASSVSRHVCSRHPILFEFARQDFPLQNVVNDNGNAIIVIDASLPYVDLIEVGDTIYVSQFGKNGTVSFINAAGGSLYFFTDIPFSAFLGGYVVHTSRQAYRLSIDVVIGNAAGATTETVTLEVNTNPQGKARVDVSSVVNSFFAKKNLFKYNETNWRDNYVHGAFFLRYQEKWKDTTLTKITDSITVSLFGVNVTVNRFYFTVDAVKNLLDNYGQNLCDYVPFNNTLLNDYPAKFLSDFSKPTYFVGYPFDLAFIYSSEVAYTSITKNEERYNGQGALIGGANYAIDSSRAGGVHRLMLAGGYSSDTKEVQVYLKGNSIEQRSYYETGFIADNYFEKIPPAPVALDPYDLTEHKAVKIATPCIDNPVYLAWRGTKGNWNYWLFSLKRDGFTSSKPQSEFSVDVTELSTATARSMFIDRERSPQKNLYTRIAAEDFSGFATIENSPCVQMLVNPDLLATQPERAWLTVNLVPKSLSRDMRSSLIEIELTIELPQSFSIPN